MGDATHERLERRLGISESVFLGLGSIVGTGVFVSIGLAAGVAGPALILSLVLAALVATANGLSSASLAANYPVSGGTYEYAHRTVHPVAGFVAGWMFLAAKSASAATAALGFAGYALNAIGAGGGWQQPLALAGVVVLVLIAVRGITGSATFTVVVVSITLLALVLYVGGGLGSLAPAAAGRLWPLWRPGPEGGSPLAGMLHGAALMFVAYTGYGRIATLGEEVREPRRTIPRAIVVTLAITLALYVAVGAVGVATAGPAGLLSATQEQAAPLVVVARTFRWGVVAPALALGAVTAMLGVLLNLILGLSRVLLAMGRRGDMPPATAHVARGATPRTAVLAVGAVILALVLIGDVRVTWSFSAFTVLIYYALTNLAALRLPPERRLFPQIIPALGLAGCLGLAFWVERGIWLAGLGVIALGLLWRFAARRLWGRGVRAEADPV